MEFDLLLMCIFFFCIFGPVVGCLLEGIDRKITARMQGRVGPSILQPYWDVRKLFEKEDGAVNGSERVYVVLALLFTLIAGGIFFGGGNLLLCVFIISLSGLMFIMAAYCTRSPYAETGAKREILQVLAYEPMILFMAIALYMACASFDVNTISYYKVPLIGLNLGCVIIFLGLLFVLTIKLRKSPFDLSMSHHAHQEIVKGMTTEMSGPTLAFVQIMHWSENVIFLGWVAMFFITANPWSYVCTFFVVAAVYFLEILIDNNFARVKWQAMLKSAWLVSLVAGAAGLILLSL